MLRHRTQAQSVQSGETKAEAKSQWVPPDERDIGDDDLQTT